MLTYAELNAPFSASLDASGSNRYPVPFRVQCFNYAIRRAASAIGWALANRKAPEEALRELTAQALFQTNITGGITLDDPSLGHSVWNVMAVIANAGSIAPATILPLAPSESKYRDDLAWNKEGKPCLRITMEQMAKTFNDKSGGMPGSPALASNPKMVDYAYCITGDSDTSTSFWTAGSELVVLPSVLTKHTLVNLTYLRGPTEFTDDSGSVEYPQSMKEQLVSWALMFAARREGDGTTLNSVAQQDAAMLFGFMIQ